MLGKNLRTRVFTACTLISIVPLIIVAYQGYHCGRMAVVDLTRLHVLSVAEARHTMITAWLNERIDDISALVSLPIMLEQVELLEDERPPAAVRALERILQSQSHGETYESLTVFDADWDIVAESEPGHHPNSDFATPAFREHVENTTEAYFGEAHIHDDHEVGIHVGSPILTADREIAGFLVANMNITASLTSLLQDRSGLWQTGKAYIVDSSFRILTEPFENGKRTAFLPQRKTPKHEWHGSEKTENVHVYDDFFSHEVIGVTLPFQIYDWAVVVEVDTDESMLWVRTLLIRVVLLLIVVLAGVILVAIWLSRLLGKPLMQLAAVTHRISEGHTDERLGPMNLEEAEEVRCAFNRMLDELRNKEEELVQSATLATVGELTSRVVHEMRNPLSSVKMNFQALQRSVEQNTENLELAEIAMSQLVRLESMLNELLQYGRPLKLTKKDVNVESLFHGVVVELRGASLEGQVEVHFQIQPEVGDIWVDVEQFTRVLVNLVRNAVEASPKGSQVEIHARSGGLSSGTTLIEVIDRGAGIREEQLEMLFKPFFTTKSEGIGLGLANVKKIIGLHSGQISAENGQTAGAIFTITLPQHPHPNSEIPR